MDELAQHEAEVAAVLDADAEADPEGDEWDDLDAEESQDPLMVSEYVVDIFKYLKQTKVRVLKRFVLLPKLIPHPQLTTPQSGIYGVAKGAGLVDARDSARLAGSSTRGVTCPIPITARDALSLHEHYRSNLVCTGRLPYKTATRRYYVSLYFFQGQGDCRSLRFTLPSLRGFIVHRI